MRKTSLLLVILSLFAINAMASSFRHDLQELHSLWSAWKSVHSKAYHSNEEAARLAIFIQNYRKIVEFNRQNEGVKLAINKFADMTGEEWKAHHTGGYTASPKRAQEKLLKFSEPVDFGLLSLPESVDWREKGAVTPVKNQQQCGSCWAFSSTGALESLYFINSGKLLTFSEQQLVDCDPQDEGCNGGLPEQAFEYTAEAGIETEQDYPYTAKDGKCHYDQSKAIKVNTGRKSVTPQNANALKAALTVQPVTIGIEADQQAFQFYSSGVIKSGCGDNLDHAVLAVGYTKVGNDEAFIVKNSWGPSWGSNGYVYISTDNKANNGNGVCGILGDPVVPTA